MHGFLGMLFLHNLMTETHTKTIEIIKIIEIESW